MCMCILLYVFFFFLCCWLRKLEEGGRIQYGATKGKICCAAGVLKVKSPFYIRLDDGAKSYKVEMMNNRKNLRNEIGV